MATHKAHATPTKDFFVRMITKDISLEDCILDLIDNCLDGARKARHAEGPGVRVDDYSGFVAKVDFEANRFDIVDNCGGIKISEAIDYAFHFGRRANTPTDGDYSIGLYGIGMKRAIFKIGNVIDIHSSTSAEAFKTHINVTEWLGKDAVPEPGKQPPSEDWDFDLDDAERIQETGTKIAITELYQGISAQFANPTFANSLSRIVGRDYAQFLAKGFEIIVNGQRVLGFDFVVRESEHFKAIRLQYTDDSGVEVDIIAGMAGLPPEDLEPPEGKRAETDYYGWFVLCNDRVVIASDKSNRTVWGDDGFPFWHYQYNGFIGVVSFHSRNANQLPWTTTKREVDSSHPAYRRAVVKMKEISRSWINYTNERKSDMDEAKRREAGATPMPLFNVAPRASLEVPRFVATTNRVVVANISYAKPASEVAKVKKSLGNSNMTNKEVGLKGVAADPIMVPHLTIKEKIALDRMMPSPHSPTDGEMDGAAGFRLLRDQIDAYHRHYRHYPMFGEIQL
ncbi:MAG: hypothetical protein JWR07_5032 [Nevskia sp.]|nr:hypothetical protein [Nevskia sp.]